LLQSCVDRENVEVIFCFYFYLLLMKRRARPTSSPLFVAYQC
jgi:hypothetical protein